MYRPDQAANEILTDAEGNFTGYGKRLNYLEDMGFYNPYYLAELQPNDRSTIRVNGNTFFNINPIKGLNIRASQAVDAFDYRNSHKAYPVGPFEGAGVATESLNATIRSLTPIPPNISSASISFTVSRYWRDRNPL